VTADQLASVALRLWDDRGYENVSLGDIAAAAGVNPRTLLRYFASKSDIVWQPIDTSFEFLHRHLVESPADQPLMSRIRQAVLASLEFLGDPDASRLRLRIISKTPVLHGNTSPPFVTWRRVLRDFVADQIGCQPDALVPEVVAATVQSATMTALIWWAQHGSGEPGGAVDLALRGLETFLPTPGPRDGPPPPAAGTGAGSGADHRVSAPG
jgi:TetR/AcrR family transcriptional regulator, regulator of mycofactocin system